MKQKKLKSKREIIKETDSKYSYYLILIILSSAFLVVSIFETRLLPIGIFLTMVTILGGINIRYWNLVERLQR